MRVEAVGVMGVVLLCAQLMVGVVAEITPLPAVNETEVPDTASSSSGDGGGMSFIVKFMIFVLTYVMTVGGLIFGIKLARDNGYCKPESTADKVKAGFRSATGGGDKK